MANKIQLRRDTTTNWANTDPTLSQGEPGLDTTTGQLKIGDGLTAWSALPFFVDAVSGYTGSAGDVGYIGSMGDIGYTGSAGSNGYVGSMGDIGYTGSAGPTNLVNTAPTSSLGQEGDVIGSIAYDTTATYFCIANYVAPPVYSGTADIAGGDGVGSPISATLVTEPVVGWTLTYSTSTSVITSVTNQTTYYDISLTDAINIPQNDPFTYGPVNNTNIWVKQAWGTTGSW